MLNDILRKMSTSDRRKTAEELQIIMKRKLKEATMREGVMVGEAKKLKDVACKLKHVKHEGNEINIKFERLRKSFEKNLKALEELEHASSANRAEALRQGKKAVKAGIAILDRGPDDSSTPPAENQSEAEAQPTLRPEQACDRKSFLEKPPRLLGKPPRKMRKEQEIEAGAQPPGGRRKDQQIEAGARPRKKPEYRCQSIFHSGRCAGQACDRKMPCYLHRKQNAAAASRVFVQSVFPMVLPFLAKRVVIPTMKNGRCFAAAYGLATAPLSQVKLQLTQRRNHSCFPVIEDGSLDCNRHNAELADSIENASKIEAILAQTSPEEAQEKDRWLLQATQRSLFGGHVVEEEQLRFIAKTLGLTVAIHFDLMESSPLLINPCDGPQLEMLFDKTDNPGVGHWSPVRRLPALHLSAICAGCNVAGLRLRSVLTL